MATALTDLREPLRAVLGDFDAELPLWDDDAIDRGLRTVFSMGKVPGFTLSTDKLYVTPTLSDPNSFALGVYHAAMLFTLPTPERYSYKSRALSESFGNATSFIGHLAQYIYDLENRTFFQSWQSLGAWMTGIFGTNLWEHLVLVNVNSPFDSLTISRGGSAIDGQGLTQLEENVLFSSPLLATATYLLGEYIPTHNARITTAVVNCVAGNGLTVLALTVNGVGVGLIELQGGITRVEATLKQDIAQSDSIRFKTQSIGGTAPTNVSVNITVEARFP